jgi:hypothetical protein
VGILDRARAAMMDYTFPGERDINGRHTFDPLTAPIVIPPCLIPSPLPPSIVTPTTTTTIHARYTLVNPHSCYRPTSSNSNHHHPDDGT